MVAPCLNKATSGDVCLTPCPPIPTEGGRSILLLWEEMGLDQVRGKPDEEVQHQGRQSATEQGVFTETIPFAANRIEYHNIHH